MSSRSLTLNVAGREISFLSLPKQPSGEVQVRVGQAPVQSISYRRESHGIALYFSDRVVFVDLAKKNSDDGASVFEVVTSDAVGTIKGISVKRAGESASDGAGGKRKRALKIKAQMPGKVVRVSVVEGQTVAAGQGLLVLEAMKMENEIKASEAGVVKKVLIQAGSAVESGAELLVIE